MERADALQPEQLLLVKCLLLVVVMGKELLGCVGGWAGQVGGVYTITFKSGLSKAQSVLLHGYFHLHFAFIWPSLTTGSLCSWYKGDYYAASPQRHLIPTWGIGAIDQLSLYLSLVHSSHTSLYSSREIRSM